MTPVGFLNMAWPGADMMIARLAADKRMAYVVSTASSTPLENLAEAAAGHVWFQMYVSRDAALSQQLLTRVKAAGYEVLVVTVDVVQPGKRDRDIRNRLQVPFRPTPAILADLMLHPGWSLGTLRAGRPGFANFRQDRALNGGPIPLAETQKRLISNDFGWDDLRRLRDAWKGPLLLKGILHGEDAALAVEAGCDGIIVSNHGGRQVDYGPAAIAALPGVVGVVANRVPVLVDGGVRRGADIVRAKALGAAFVFAGRAFAYGVAAASEPGCARAFDILETELRRTLGQIGRPRFETVDHSVLFGKSS
jgi:isopentenyl diphosphate isomerase/L-lactate dehydrogenase-like FMN-dependent dehydrogenase